MTGSTAARIAWGMYCLTLALFAVFAGFGESSGAASLVTALLAVSAYSVVGAVVVGRDPRNALAWMFCLAPLAIGVSGAATVYVEHGGTDWPARVAVALVADTGWLVGLGLPIAFFGLLIPDGRLPSRRWRPAAWLAASAVTALTVGTVFGEQPIDTGSLHNPIAVPYADQLAHVAGVIVVPVMMLGVAAAVTRYRGGGQVVRQQLRWIVVALIATFAIGVIGNYLPEPIFFASWCLLPAAFGVAIFRYRLYEIDVIIRRTLIYTALVAVLAAVYLAGITGIGWVLRDAAGQSSALAVTLSTLLVAGAFQPLRTRIQRAVDHRFYRGRYDANRAIGAFSARLREQIDLDALSTELLATVEHTVQPAAASLWLRAVTIPERPTGTTEVS